MPFSFLGIYIKNSNKKLFYNRKYVAKITNIHYKTTVFDNYKADIYWNKVSRKKIGHHTRLFSLQHLNQL